MKLLLIATLLISALSFSAKAQSFDATSYGTVLAWYRAEDVSGVNNDPVSAWPDHSGNGWDLAQATGALQPTLKTNIVGGKSTVRFAATNYIFVASMSTNVGTIVCVIGNVTYTSANSVGGTGSKRMITFFPDALTLYSDGSDLLGTSAYRVNGSSTNVFPGSSAFAAVALTGTPAAPGLFVLGASFVNDPYNGDIAELVLYSDQLSTANQDAAANCLMAKYGLGGSCGATPTPAATATATVTPTATPAVLSANFFPFFHP